MNDGFVCFCGGIARPLPRPPLRFVRNLWKCDKCGRVADPLAAALTKKRSEWALMCTRCGERAALSAGFGRFVCIACGLESMPCGWRGVDPPVGPDLGCVRCARRPWKGRKESARVEYGQEFRPVKVGESEEEQTARASSKAKTAAGARSVLEALKDVGASKVASSAHAKTRAKK